MEVWRAFLMESTVMLTHLCHSLMLVWYYAPRVKHPYYICTLDDHPQYYWHDNVFLGFVQVLRSWETWVRATEETRWQSEVRFVWDVSTKGSKLGGKWDLNSNSSGKFLFCPWKGFRSLTCTLFENLTQVLPRKAFQHQSPSYKRFC